MNDTARKLIPTFLEDAHDECVKVCVCEKVCVWGCVLCT